MIVTALVALLFASDPSRLAIVTVQTVRSARTIVRVPRQAEPRPEIRWREQRGPRCVEATRLAGASVTSPESIDLILRGQTRLRARLEDRCPAMDFYTGFYLRPGRDGMVCAGRDTIRSRAGATCGIERFRELVPDRRRRSR